MVRPISKAGLTSMRGVPLSCSAYMPPIDVPMMRSGCSRCCMARSMSMASAGCRGMSSATTVASGNSVRSMVTVPDCADDPKPCTYIIFLPCMRSGYCLTY